MHYSLPYSHKAPLYFIKVAWIIHSRDIFLRNFPRWLPAAILYLIKPGMAPFDPPSPKPLPLVPTISGSKRVKFSALSCSDWISCILVSTILWSGFVESAVRGVDPSLLADLFGYTTFERCRRKFWYQRAARRPCIDRPTNVDCSAQHVRPSVNHNRLSGRVSFLSSCLLSVVHLQLSQRRLAVRPFRFPRSMIAYIGVFNSIGIACAQ